MVKSKKNNTDNYIKLNNMRAMMLYKNILKNVEKLTGNKTTYSDDLNKISNELLPKKIRGVFPSDKIPQLNDLVPYAIINIDKSTEPGSHWLAMAKMPNIHDTIIYDSFGRGYQRILPSVMKSGNGRIINTDPDAEQKITETNCGARCLAWLIFFDLYGSTNALMI